MGLELEKLISSDVFRRLRKLKLIDETELRYLDIREEYDSLRNNYFIF